MSRTAQQTYNIRLMIAMTIYIVVLLGVWPLARTVDEPLLKVGCALAPVLPLLYVIWITAQKILNSDELEQRTHLIGLGVATAVVSVFSIVSGFLAVSNLMTLDWASIVLIWIFPLLMISYGAARTYAARRYGTDMCDEHERMPVHLLLLWLAMLFGVVAALLHWRGGKDDVVAMMLGMTLAFAAGAALFAFRRRRRAASAE